MESKICKECEERKDISEFIRCSSYKDNVRNTCKKCGAIKSKKWREENKQKVRDWREKNREKINIYKKNDYIKNKNKYLEHKKLYYINNKESILLKIDEYEKNKSEERKLEDNIKTNKWQKNKLKNDPLFYIKKNTTSYILASIRKNGFTKKSKIYQILGCTFEELKEHLESKFEPWMNWENRGLYNGELNYGWDMDHIIPLSIAENENELLNLLFYKNLQPLCSKINRDIKRCKVYE